MEPILQTKFVFPAAAQLGCGRRLQRMRQVGVSINHPLAPMPTAHCQLSDYHTSTNSTQKKTHHFHLYIPHIIPPSIPPHFATITNNFSKKDGPSYVDMQMQQQQQATVKCPILLFPHPHQFLSVITFQLHFYSQKLIAHHGNGKHFKDSLYPSQQNPIFTIMVNTMSRSHYNT